MKKKYLNITLIPLITLISFLTFSFYICPSLDRVDSISKQLFISGIFSAMAALVMCFFVFRYKLSEPAAIAFLGAAVILALGVRLSLFDYISTDYSMYLDIWTDALRDAPGLSGWTRSIGDYNMPYLYILTFIAKLFPERLALYMTKTVSVCFDFVLAYYLMQISTLIKKNINTQLAVFCAVLFVPTFILNSAYWSQCDVIYSSFAAAFIYYALSKRPNLAVIMCGIAFSFKLQTVFILPMVIVFLFLGKIKLKNLLWFPAVFLALITPALIAGKPFLETISIYYHQTGEYERLFINAPVIYQFLPIDVPYSPFKNAGIMFTGAAVLALLYFLYVKRDSLNDNTLLTVCFIFVLGIPFFLPCMHERYFYLADVFSIVMLMINKKRWFIPLGVIYASFRAYTDFLLMCKKEDINYKFLAIIYFAALVIALIDFYKNTKNQKPIALTVKN